MAPQPTANQRAQQQIDEMKKRQEAQAKELARLQKFNQASNELSSFESAFMAKAEGWMIAARNVGSAYKMAADAHKKALADQSASDALSDQILFSILSVATVGGLSWLSSSIQARNANALSAAQTRLAEAKRRLADANSRSVTDPRYGVAYRKSLENRVKMLETMPKPVGMMVEALEDTLQAGADKAWTVVGPQLTAEKLVDASQDPQVFQNEEENKISRVKKLAFTTFSEIRKDWKDKPSEYWDTYDTAAQAKVHAEWQREADTLAGDEELRPVQEMADEIERGIWKKYILEHHSHRDFGLFETAESYDFVGYHVVQRLAKLGVTQPLGLKTNIPEGLMDPALIGPNEAYITLLVKWAINYQVKSLLKPKKQANAFAGARAGATASIRK